ncbi:DNA-directed RNA polymerase subunit P [Candidatus Woesearchaeota archaeon]|nr:DNA-directed RNA polymerase subunit P [Candidatus Woesearchaeota archaeon]
MVDYKCFSCGQRLSDEELRRKLRCPYCGDKLFYKPRQVPTKVVAR